MKKLLGCVSALVAITFGLSACVDSYDSGYSYSGITHYETAPENQRTIIVHDHHWHHRPHPRYPRVVVHKEGHPSRPHYGPSHHDAGKHPHYGSASSGAAQKTNQ